MSGQVKLPVLIVVIILALTLSSGSFYLLQKERLKAVSLQEQLEDVKAKQKITEAKLQESNDIITDLETRLKTASTQVESLTSELSEVQTDKQKLLKDLAELKSEWERENIAKKDLEKTIAQAKEDSDKIQTQLKTLESEKASLEAKLNEIQAQTRQAQAETQPAEKEGVELGTIVVSPEANADAGASAAQESPEASTKSAGLEGKVLVINKDYNFAVINLGSKDGINVGDIFSAYHNNKYVGDIKVEKVHDSMSAMGFATPDIKDKINEGDKVVRKD